MMLQHKYTFLCHGEFLVGTNIRIEAENILAFHRREKSAGITILLSGDAILLAPLGKSEVTSIPLAPPGKYVATKEGVRKAGENERGYGYDKAERYYYDTLIYGVTK